MNTDNRINESALNLLQQTVIMAVKQVRIHMDIFPVSDKRLSGSI